MSHDGHIRDTKAGGFSAAFDVPHVRFKRTAEGFVASWSKEPEQLFKTMHGANEVSDRAAKNTPQGGNLIYALFLLIVLVIRLLFSVFWVIGRLAFSKTEVVVDGDYVTVAKMRMTRPHFGGFSVDHYLSDGRKNYAVLGYSFANRRYAFGGVWEIREAEEVAGALNAHLSELGRGGATRSDGARPLNF